MTKDERGPGNGASNLPVCSHLTATWAGQRKVIVLG